MNTRRRSKMSWIITLVVAFVMTMGTASSAFADTTDKTITFTNDGHKYSIFQIMTGEKATNGSFVNAKWGASAKGKNVGDAVSNSDLTTIEGLASNVSSTAKTISGYVNLDGSAFRTVDTTSATTVSVPVGYYLIRDDGMADTSKTKDTSYSLYVVRVIDDDLTFSAKRDVPSSQKKVKEKNDSNTSGLSDWQDAADYDIGDNVPFQLQATINATRYADYDTYYLAFNDTQSAGLTLNDSSVVVKRGNKTIPSTQYNFTKSGQTFKIEFTDLKKVVDEDGGAIAAGDTITVEYTAQLNSSAVIGSAGNPNEMYIEYSNNPNSTSKGETTPDKVIVFTYTLDIDKVDEDNAPLAGAGFTLYKYNASSENEDKWEAVGDELTGTDKTNFQWKGIDAGQYKLVETTVPANYTGMSDMTFTVSATYDTNADNPALKTLTTNLTTQLSTAITGDNDGKVYGDVQNRSGSTLPSTGAMGTMIFIGLGLLLMIGAAVVLITRRKMNAFEE